METMVFLERGDLQGEGGGWGGGNEVGKIVVLGRGCFEVAELGRIPKGP